MTLKEIRQNAEISQKEAAAILGVARKTYIKYENNPQTCSKTKYDLLCDNLLRVVRIDEEHGVLSLAKIKDTCSKIFKSLDVEYCYLFGSYAKGKATEVSDVDLLISTSVSGLAYFGLVEDLREQLGKKVDLLSKTDLIDNFELTNEILKNGIKIYG